MPAIANAAYAPLRDLYSRPPSGFHDEDYEYWFEIAFTASQTLTSIPLVTAYDAPFFVRGWIGGYVGSGSGLIRMTLIDPQDKNLISTGYLDGTTTVREFNENFFPTGPRPSPAFSELYVPAGAMLQLTGVEYNAQSITQGIGLRGVKRFRD